MNRPKADLNPLTEAQDKPAPRRRKKKEPAMEQPMVQRHRKVEDYSHMPVKFGKVHAKVFGGPFPDYVPGQRRVVSVRMAAEFPKLLADIVVPTHDFSTPNMDAMHNGIHEALRAILRGNDLYVGCKGGIGRTGLFMACLAKVMFDYSEQYEDDPDSPLHYAVQYVRKHYYAHAVETGEQQDFIRAFDTSEHVEYLKQELDPAVEVRIVEREVIKEVVKEVPVYVFNPVKAFLQFWGLDKRG